MKRVIKKIIFAFLAASFGFAGTVLAEDRLPDMMVGQSKLVMSDTNSNQSIRLNDYDKVDAGTPFPAGTVNFTVMFWTKPSLSGTSNQELFEYGIKPNNVTGNGVAAQLRYNPTQSNYTLYYAINEVAGPQTTSVTITPDVWTHIAFVRNGNTFRWYINGTYLSQVSINSTTSIYNTGNFYIGNNGSLTPNNFVNNLLLDEFRVYNAALSWDAVSDRANDLLNGYPVDPDPNLLSAWFFDGSLGDSKGNDDGTHMPSQYAEYLYDVHYSSESADTFYGGFTGNEAVFNNGLSGQASTDTNPLDLFGFDKETLLSCLDGPVVQMNYRCFIKNTASESAVSIMNSQTYINNTPVMETAALKYKDKTIVGDTYGTMSNFSFWGRSLHQSGVATNSDAYWQMGNYPLNENAQSTWLKSDGNPTDQFAKYDSKISLLQEEAKKITGSTWVGLPVNNWYMQTDQTNIYNLPSAGSESKFPEGRVWKYVDSSGNLADVNIGSNKKISFTGVGTIIVKSLTVGSGSTITPKTTESKLGIISMGDITFAGNNTFRGTTLSKGNFNVGGDNCDFTGSYVAREFNITGTGNIRFFYDYDLDNMWPPGFRALNMPTAKSSR